MVIFHSYVSLPEGIIDIQTLRFHVLGFVRKILQPYPRIILGLVHPMNRSNTKLGVRLGGVLGLLGDEMSLSFP